MRPVTEEQANLLANRGFDGSSSCWWNYGALEVFGADDLLDSLAGEPNRPLAPNVTDALLFMERRFGYHFEILVDRTAEPKWTWAVHVYESYHWTETHRAEFLFTTREAAESDLLNFLLK